jgi:hypothetical protein
MSHSGDAAEQIVRMTLQGTEVAAKITGTAAKEIALLIIAALKNNNKESLKLKGKARLSSMLKSGKALEIISIKERDLAKFSEGAKEYGIVYCVLRNTKSGPDGLCDVMVKADDSPKISRLMERFEFATVDKAKIESEIVADMGARSPDVISDEIHDVPDVNDTEKLLDDLLGTTEGKAEPDKPNPENVEPVKAPEVKQEFRPLVQGGRGEKSNPSVPTSETKKKPEKTSFSKPSVKDNIREIKAERKLKEVEAVKRDERENDSKSKKEQKYAKHKQPKNGKPKSKKMKGNR